MSLEADILETKHWLSEHQYLMSNDVLEGYCGQLDGLEAAADQAKELETLVKQAHELLSGEWDPDDVDRHKFLVRLERAIP